MSLRTAAWPRFACALMVALAGLTFLHAAPDPKTYWNVDELRPGMKGYGLTVMKGTKIEKFDAEVLGVLKNTAPGRDMVLCRLAGLDLERTGIIAGMSGSPIYIDEKLVGAVAYAWPYGKDPIAGVTPFSQMHEFVESFEKKEIAESAKPVKVGLRQPVQIEGHSFDHVTVSQSFDEAVPANADGLWLMPLRTPLATSGFTAHSLKLLTEAFPQRGLVPMQSGGTSGKTLAGEKDIPLEKGGALVVALITGDFDMSGIGTVTHIDGKRVYGFGHPMMSLGSCDFPLMTGHVHTIYPRWNVSFKMGTPLQTVGTITADVSTCIAGWLDKKPDMLPMSMSVRKEPGGQAAQYHVEMVRHKQLLPALIFAALTNAIDQEGDLPEEITAAFTLRIEMEGHEPIVIRDRYAGASYSGGRAPAALYNPVALLVQQILSNPFEKVRFTKIECETEIEAGRHSAEIEGVQLESDTYAPGETVRGTVYMRPWKGTPQKVPVALKLPEDLPEGSYSITLSEEGIAAKADLRSQPQWNNPLNLEQLLAGYRLLAAAKRTNLTLRLPLPASGVALDGKALPNLPPSMVQTFSQTHRTAVQSISKAVESKQPVPWVIQGSETVRINVTKNKRTSITQE
ncbi:MAG TPA: SpoIVB peptidase S55 domain-containing protein [Gemmataceae bacterium]|nr:SpoIVB peptidase S55 domain-containing protein [Gemmataceae bacterium]